MARGGYRPGAGRPRGKTRQPSVPMAPAQDPLAYMIATMNDPRADPARRDRMAIAAAPYLHPKIAENRLGKRELTLQAARDAAEGTEWEDLLPPLPEPRFGRIWDDGRRRSNS